MAHIRRATVFGGSGFIGRYIVQRLARRGATIIVVGRHAQNARFLQPLGDVGQIALVNAGLDDEARIAETVAGADLVVNLVGILAEQGKQRFEPLQHLGAGRIAWAAARAGVERLIHVSAIGADAASPSRYASSKGRGERAVRDAFPSATILRPSIVFGPEDQFFNRFAAMARQAPFLPLIGGGLARFQPVYVGDVADAALAAFDQPESAGKTYELGGPRVESFRGLMEDLRRQIERPDIRLIPLPFALAGLIAGFAELLPNPALTRDQVLLLRRDNVVGPDALTLADLGIAATGAEVILPTYLERFRPGGWFSRNDLA